MPSSLSRKLQYPASSQPLITCKIIVRSQWYLRDHSHSCSVKDGIYLLCVWKMAHACCAWGFSMKVVVRVIQGMSSCSKLIKIGFFVVLQITWIFLSVANHKRHVEWFYWNRIVDGGSNHQFMLNGRCRGPACILIYGYLPMYVYVCAWCMCVFVSVYVFLLHESVENSRWEQNLSEQVELSKKIEFQL